MNRRVKYARFHQGIYVPGAGELGSVFPPTSKTLENISMSVYDAGLDVSFVYKGVLVELLVPLANVAVMTLIPEEKPAVVKAAKSA